MGVISYRARNLPGDENSYSDTSVSPGSVACSAKNRATPPSMSSLMYSMLPDVSTITTINRTLGFVIPELPLPFLDALLALLQLQLPLPARLRQAPQKHHTHPQQ